MVRPWRSSGFQPQWLDRVTAFLFAGVFSTDASEPSAIKGQVDPIVGSQPPTKLGVPVIAVAGLTKTFPESEVAAVDDLSFAVNQGEVLAILGPSGCGKTTTLRLLAGFEIPDAGDVRMRDKVVTSPDHWVPPEKRGLGMVFQHIALFPHLTVLENVTYGLSRMKSVEKRRQATEMLKLVGMDGLMKRYPHQLSGGQQQRVALARALAPKPLVLLMDEPFASLDADLRAQMRRELKLLLAQLGTTVIIVTHDQEEAFLLADRILILHKGRLQQLNTPDNVYHRPASRFEANFVGLADFVPAKVVNRTVSTELGEFTYDAIPPDGPVELMVRPDDLRIEPDDKSTSVIVDREFKGADNLYSVRLPSGKVVRSAHPSEPVYSVGQAVKVNPNLTHVILFPREQEEIGRES
ncbi:ABC transporter ATP-binding protein [Dehalococcoidia bacterium]|nr:ABC transporter ATP-binding protein [Dehalococcoidia bacterium]